MTDQLRTDICLVACSASKRSCAASAESLYTSDLFQKSREYARFRFDNWYILSAKHGLLERNCVIDPYDVELNAMPKVSPRGMGAVGLASAAELHPAG